MTFGSGECTVIGGWQYYNFEAINSASRCSEIAQRCRDHGFLARIQAAASAALGALSLTISYFVLKNTLYIFAVNELPLAGLVFSCPILGLVSLPFLMLSIVTARCWSHYHHLEKQAAKADLREEDLHIGL